MGLLLEVLRNLVDIVVVVAFLCERQDLFKWPDGHG
jgi:hypothetical protein